MAAAPARRLRPPRARAAGLSPVASAFRTNPAASPHRTDRAIKKPRKLKIALATILTSAAFSQDSSPKKQLDSASRSPSSGGGIFLFWWKNHEANVTHTHNTHDRVEGECWDDNWSIAVGFNNLPHRANFADASCNLPLNSRRGFFI